MTYSITKHLRRIDVLVTTPGFTIAIGNKVDADEGDEQLDDYHDHLVKIASTGYCLVFLTPDGREPKSLKQPTRENLRSARRLVEMREVARVAEPNIDTRAAKFARKPRGTR